MRLVTDRLSLDVKYKKVSVNALVPKPAIVMRSSDGKLVEKKMITFDGEVLEGFHWKYFTEDGQEISSKEIHYFQVKEDGSEVETRWFDRTKEIRIIKEVPATSMNGMLEASVYELFHTDEKAVGKLYEEAERYLKEDIVGVALFSWGRGFIQYYAVVYPVVKDGKFVWVMKLTQTQVVFSHLMEIPAIKEPVPQPRTVQVLPPIEALVKTKKK